MNPSMHVRAGLVTFGLATFVMALVVCMLMGGADAQTDPPTDGDWVVADTTVLDNVTVVLNGNLTVTAGGDLTLKSVRLQINCSRPGQYWILVKAEGSMTLMDTDDNMLTTSDATILHNAVSVNHYTWRCEAGSRLRISNSGIVDCGINLPLMEGLVVETDDARIENTTFTSGHWGIHIHRSSPYLFFLVISDMDGPGIYVTEGNPDLIFCIVGRVRIGIVIDGSDDVYMALCYITETLGAGIQVDNSTVKIVNCEIEEVNENGIEFLRDCSGSVKGTVVNDTLRNGIYVGVRSNVNITACEVSYSYGKGIYILESTSEVLGTRVHNCSGDAVLAFDSRVRFDTNVFENCSGSGLIHIGRDDGTFQNITCINNGMNGIHFGALPNLECKPYAYDLRLATNGRAGLYVDNNVSLTLQDSDFVHNGQYAIYCADGAHVVWRIQGNVELVDETIRFRGWIDVGWTSVGSSLKLTNTSLYMVTVGTLSYLHVNDSTIIVTDGDNDPETKDDSSEITVVDPSGGEDDYVPLVDTGGSSLILRNSHFSHVRIAFDTGSVDARGCEFEELHGPVEGNSLSFVDCDFKDSEQAIYGTSETVSITGCSFYRVDTPVVLEGANGAVLARCRMVSYEVGLQIDHSDDVSVSNSSVSFGKDGIHVEGSSGLALTSCTISNNDAHGIMMNRSTALISDTSVLESGAGGIILDDCTVRMDHVSVYANTRVGIMANRTDLAMDNSSITDTNGIGIWVRRGTSVYDPKAYLMWDCYLGQAEAYDVRVEGSYPAKAYNTFLDPESVRVFGEASFEMRYLLHTQVVVTGKESIPPPPVGYLVVDVYKTTWTEGTMTDESNLPPNWVTAYIMTAGAELFYTPYTVTVTVAGRDWSEEVDIGVDTGSTIHVHPDLVAVVDLPQGIFEGEDVTFDASASVGYPFGMAVYEWDFDTEGDPGVDRTGPVVKWTFPGDGEYIITLNMTDEVGNRNGTTFVIYVLDEWPYAQIVTAPIGDVDEDEEVRFDGRYDLVVDPVLLLEWDFGDGERAEGASVTHYWQEAGVYNVTFTVVDMEGQTDTASVLVTVVNVAPVAVVPGVALEAGKGEPVYLDGSLSHDTASDNGSLVFLWHIGDELVLTGVQGTHRFQRSGLYTVVMTVTDDDGASDTATIEVTVTNRPPTIGDIEDYTIPGSGQDHRVYLRDVVEDPDDPEEALSVVVSVEPDLIVDVDAVYSNETGWYVTLYSLPGTSGQVTVTVKADDGDGGTASTSFRVTVEGDGGGTSWMLIALVLAALAAVLVVVVMALRSRGDDAGGG